jgi:anti-sigma B factor antagonist
MGWNISEGEKALKVDIDGRLVAAVAPSLREEVLGMMKDGTNVLFDLSGMVHIDSSGLGVLVQILQKAKAGGGKVVLAALQPGPKIVFDITKVSRVFEIVPTVDDAKF